MSQNEAQILTLTVLGSQAAQLGPRSRKTFMGKDGSIGRSEDCDWVLSASGVSRVHAMIRCVNGIYFVEDHSTNGMLHNDKPMIKGDPAALNDGDHLRIDNFDIEARMQSDSETIVQVAPRGAPSSVGSPLAPAPASPAPAAAADDLLDFGLGAPATPAQSAPPAGDALIPDAPAPAPSADALDPLSFLDEPPAAAPPSRPPDSAGEWNHSAGMQDHFRPPTSAGQHGGNVLPDDWDLGLGDDSAAPAPAPQPAPPPPIPAPAAPVTPPAAPPAPVAAAPAAPAAMAPGQEDILRIVVDGVMDVLRARAEIKNTFRLPMTVIQRSENNPLKFALGTDEALKKILAAPDPAYLTGTAAFDDAFDDIRCHQMAMLAGVRAGFDALLRHFDPDRYEAEDTSSRVNFGGKGKHWDRYRGHYQSLVADPDATFRRLFGDEFARAYEEQLARLKSARRAQRSKPG